MKVELRQILNAKDAIEHLLNQSMPMSISFTLSDLVQELNPKIDNFYEKQKVLLEKHGKLVDAEIGKYELDNVERYNKEIDELLDTMVKLTFEPIEYEKVKDVPILPVFVPALKEFVVKNWKKNG